MREPGLIDLTNFIEDEMVLVNDSLFSREAVGQYEEKPLNKDDTFPDFRTYFLDFRIFMNLSDLQKGLG